MPDESKLIGNIALKRTDIENIREIGYWIHGDYINMGYATEACSALIKVVFEIDDVERIEIHCDDKNIISSAIPKKRGFVKKQLLDLMKRMRKGIEKRMKFGYYLKMNITRQVLSIMK